MTNYDTDLRRFKEIDGSVDDIFQSLDRNMDGELSVEEFETALDRYH
jgi:Ca2+-binding EF-hand superfamily protein